MVGSEDDGASLGNVLAAHPAQAKVEMKEGLQDGPSQPVDDRVSATPTNALVQRLGDVRPPDLHAWHTRARRARYSKTDDMAIDRTHTLRGALAGALAAGGWAAQMPADKRVFACDYDDVALLGKAVTRGPGWWPAGLALHLANGAAFGAVYANVVPRVPLPSWAVGPLAGMVENLASWPLATVSDRVHPARKELPVIGSSRRALAQATWRHLVFGVLLGEVERRLNAEPRSELPDYEQVASTNGHARLEHAISV